MELYTYAEEKGCSLLEKHLYVMLPKGKERNWNQKGFKGKEQKEIGRDVPRLAFLQTFKLVSISAKGHWSTGSTLLLFWKTPALFAGTLLLYLSQNLRTEVPAAFNRQSSGSRLESQEISARHGSENRMPKNVDALSSLIGSLRMRSPLQKLGGKSTLCRHTHIPVCLDSLATWLVAGHLEIASARTLFPGTRALPTCTNQVVTRSATFATFFEGKSGDWKNHGFLANLLTTDWIFRRFL